MKINMIASTVMLIKSVATNLSTPAYESIVIIKRTFRYEHKIHAKCM